MRFRTLAAASVLLTCGWSLTHGTASPAGAAFHIPLRTSTGVPIVWKSLPVKYSIHGAGSDNISDNSDTLAMQLAFAEWNGLAGSNVKLTELTSAAAKNIHDWIPLGSHVVYFDEDGDPNLIPAGSNIIAITPVGFEVSTGKILDADIVMNGADFIFSTGLVNGTMDVWSTTTHEAGHFLGLDHSGMVGSTMWPYEVTGGFATRTIAEDDAAGMRNLYPKTVKGSIQGTVKRASNGTTVQGAHVWARRVNDGRVASAGFSDAIGKYTISDLDPGTYRIVAAPLDGGMTGNNLSNFNKAGLQSNFSPGETAPVALLGTETAAAPDVLVGNDVTLNVTAPSTSVELHPGQALNITLGGTGLTGATVTIPDSAGAFVIGGSAPTFNLTASVGALPGLYDIIVTNVSGHVADWSAGIEVLPPALTFASITPNVATSAGGTTVVLTGSNFAGTPALIFGDALATNVHVVAPDRITATAPKHAPEAVAVTLVGDSGEPVELVGTFNFVDGVNPGITSVFPQVGSSTGGTGVTILGTTFAAGATVKFGGVNGTNVQFVSATEIHATSPALPSDTYDVQVVNPGPGGLVATALNGFTTVVNADPLLTSATPDTVPSTGGTTVALLGDGFDSGMTLSLFADTKTGSGGLPATPVPGDAQNLTFEAPANVKGAKSFVGDAPIVLTKANGQTALATGLLTYVPLMSKTGNLSGAIDPVGDVDRVFVDTIAGTTLLLKVNALGVPILTPEITLKDPSDAVVATAGATGSKTASLTSVPLPTNGRYVVEIRGLDSTTGKYKFTFKETLPKSQTKIAIPANPPTTVGPAEAQYAFSAKAGSLLKGTITAKNGLLALVSSLDGPSGSILSDPDVIAKIVVLYGGKTIQFKGVPLKELGNYSLAIGASGMTTGTITGNLTITPPKTIVSYTEK